jgi:hypothetical protein
MANLHQAIFALNPNIVTIRGEEAFDADENPMSYDMAVAQAKLLEMQAEETAKEQAQIDAKASALSKLSKLGLTADEISAITGVK